MDEMLKVFSRINASSDGQDFVAFLKNLSSETYNQWKKTGSDMNDIFKGQLIAIDGLIKEFETADDKLAKLNDKKEEQISYEHNPSY
jgi:hypothetical protein